VFEQGRFYLSYSLRLIDDHSVRESADAGADDRRVPGRNLPVDERPGDKRKARLQLFATHRSPGSQIGG
jgi:hypothetical protein